jgi:hypothetical protein
MVTLLLAQLWWIMPVFIVLVYLAVGWLITNALVKRGFIETPFNYLFSIILWLPVGVLKVIWHILSWLLIQPKLFAERQLEKHSK